jgi:coproporphyrinogen III oxidase
LAPAKHSSLRLPARRKKIAPTRPLRELHLNNPPILRPEIEAWLADFQLRLCQQLEAADGGAARFLTDEWQRPGGGGGRSKVLENGRILEKGGVGFSAVWGEMSEAAARRCTCPTRAFSPPAYRWYCTRAAPACPSST